MSKKQMTILGAAIAALLIVLLIAVPRTRQDEPPVPPTAEGENQEAQTENESSENEEADKPSDTPEEDKPSGEEDKKEDASPEEDKKPEDKPEDKPSQPEQKPEPKPEQKPEQKPSEPQKPAEPQKPVPDENGMMKIGDMWVKAPSALSESSIKKFADKLTSLKNTYLGSANSVHYSVIPDKSFYASDKTEYFLNHNTMVSKLNPLLSGWNYIEISDLLALDDFYITDAHWKQEDIVPVANRIAKNLGFSVASSEFSQSSREGFCGDYSRHIGKGTTEKISWMESAATKAASVNNYQRPESKTVYDPSLLSTKSPYDLYLGGPTPLVTMTNPNAGNEKKLIIFRDSFGSSLAPLLLSGYSEIQLVDIRYMVSDLLPQYVTFDGADVLFLYSAEVVNNSTMLR